MVEFDSMDWIVGGLGCRYKKFASDGQQLRLVEFSEGFVEENWCMCGHSGYVLDGEMCIDFDGVRENYVKGDIIFIPKGETAKHKVIMGVGGFVQLLLFENLE